MNLPLKLRLLMWAGWVNRAQEKAIDYLEEENRRCCTIPTTSWNAGFVCECY